ncbi:TonB-dependent receptor domain-containing protein [Sphingobacterium thalpophilum]|uniref:TonB-dependent receptor domain-containing protein n=1 Tax=Sphingobacterium thalpophilum TaxID=259 RepID=UPI0024A64BD8|nr:TonB-dependent receptor [Sphingobacterium thalpophilum]
MTKKIIPLNLLFLLFGLTACTTYSYAQNADSARRAEMDSKVPKSAHTPDTGLTDLAGRHRLEAVEIRRRLPVIENKEDKIIYHVAKDASLRGTTAEEVFRKLPMVSLSYDGKAALRGNQNVRIFINGKPSSITRGNLAEALRMLPSEQIKSVEIITNPPSKYDAEGAAGIINILTGRPTVSGLNGSIGTTIGTRQSNQNSSIAGRIGRFGITGSVGNTWSYPIASRITSANSTLSGKTIFSQTNDSRNRRNGTQISVAMDYELDTNTMLVSNLNFNQLLLVTSNKMQTVYGEEGTAIGASVDNRQPAGNFDFSTDYIRKFSKKAGEISLSFQYLNGKNNTTYKGIYGLLSERGQNLGNSDEYTAQVDFKRSIQKIALDFGVKLVDRNISSTVAIDSSTQIGETVRDMQRSYSFGYTQKVWAGYAAVGFPIGKSVNVKAGLRWEKTILKAEESAHIAQFMNHTNDLFPNLSVSYNYSENSTLKMSYAKRIQRPSLYYLNPFRNEADRSNQMQGNPNLRSEIIQHVELGGDFALLRNRGQLYAAVYYRNTDHSIEPILETTTAGGRTVLLQTFQNIGTNKNIGASVYTSITLFKGVNIKANMDVYTYANDPAEKFLYSSRIANKTTVIYKTFAGLDLNLGKGYMLDSYLFHDSPQRTFQGEFAAFNLWNISFKKKVLNEAAILGLTIVDPFSNSKNLGSYSETPLFIQKGNFALPFRSFGLSFSWQFGKNSPNAYRSKEKQIRNNDQKKAGQ